MKSKTFLLFLFFACPTYGYIFGQSFEFGNFIDKRDKRAYKYVKINNITWMAENLKYKSRNGSWCYDNNKENCEKYGRLYNQDVSKNVCPDGWHLPSKDEYDKLFRMIETSHDEVLLGEYYSFLGHEKLMSEIKLNGGGWRNVNGAFSDLETLSLWTSTPYPSENSSIMNYCVDLDEIGASINEGLMDLDFQAGYSIRCIKD